MNSYIKILVTALLLTGTFTILNAQIGVGLRGGINYGTAEFDNEVDMTFKPDYNLGLTGGLVIEVGIFDFFAVQPEVNFIQKGYKIEQTNFAGTVEAKTYLNYIEVPLLFKGRFGTETVKGFVMAGPSFGYAFDGVMKIKDHDDYDIDFDKDMIKRTDFGAVFGAGVGIAAGPGTFFLDGRYGLGFTNLNEDNTEGFDSKWRNSGFNVGIGYVLTVAEMW